MMEELTRSVADISKNSQNLPTSLLHLCKCLCVCTCLCVWSKTMQGCRLLLSRGINRSDIMISRLVGWCVCLCACMCLCAPQREARAMFWSDEERDTEGLFPPSLLRIPIYTNKIWQDKQNNNCMQSIATYTYAHIYTHKDNWAQPYLNWVWKKQHGLSKNFLQLSTYTHKYTQTENMDKMLVCMYVCTHKHMHSSLFL